MIVIGNISSTFADALSDTAAALRVPVLILALLALAVTAVETGRFVGELIQRYKVRGVILPDAIAELAQPTSPGFPLADISPSHLVTKTATRLLAVQNDHALLEDALADFELAVQKRLDRTRMLVRAGPALGLMGTLIPLAPGLSALANGNVAALAGELKTAFAVTVVGLLVGMVAFSLTLVRQRFYSEYLLALERSARRLESLSDASLARDLVARKTAASFKSSTEDDACIV